MTADGRLRIGTSGYQYEHWRGIFYPPRLAPQRWFQHYATHFDTVEINNTFYRLPRPEVFAGWYHAAPNGFLFALKFSRYGSHLKHLQDPQATLPRFMTCASELGDRLGPLLVQLPPHWHADPDRLRAFLSQVPRDQRCAVEVRHASWLCDAVYQVLRDHNAALCIHDRLDRHPRLLTASWSYLRYHGGPAGTYSPRFLRDEAGRLREWCAAGMQVYAYFNNDYAGYALKNALDLRRYAGAD